MSKEQDKDQEVFESEVEETVEETPSKKDSKPWNRKFGEDENLKNRQYSRTARNQPAKEATTLSKVLLFIIVVTVIAPFLLFIFVNAQRSNDEIPNRSAEQINISRNSEISQLSSADESESTSDESESVEESSSEISREPIEPEESIETVPETPPTPTVPEVPATPIETPPTTGGTYIVQAGDSWYGIARNNGVDLNALLNANGASTETAIFPGEAILLP
ncbi:LysM peptidoglycan-binding domain-containing protein [Aerococcaceae bacterium DSM 111021]|nr:LysM peptidoglycan-binding domain-containing protein [Aerococcaceae bacterium DSM 111021]